jgi:hypothetical protein
VLKLQKNPPQKNYDPNFNSDASLPLQVNPDPDLNSDPEIDISKCSLNRANGDLDDMLDEEQSIGAKVTNSSSRINY